MEIKNRYFVRKYEEVRIESETSGDSVSAFKSVLDWADPVRGNYRI